MESLNWAWHLGFIPDRSKSEEKPLALAYLPLLSLRSASTWVMLPPPLFPLLLVTSEPNFFFCPSDMKWKPAALQEAHRFSAPEWDCGDGQLPRLSSCWPTSLSSMRTAPVGLARPYHVSQPKTPNFKSSCQAVTVSRVLGTATVVYPAYIM